MKPTKTLILLLLPLFLLMGITACENKDPEPEQLTFELSSTELNLESVDPLQVPYAGKSFTVTVRASPEVTWGYSVRKGNDFITIASDGENKGDGMITITIDKNTTSESREGVVEITNSLDAEKAYAVFTQVAVNMPAINILPQKEFTGISSNGEEISVTITTDPVVDLTFSDGEDWITKSTEKENTWIIAENETDRERTGKVSILYDTDFELAALTFTQKAPAQALRFAVMSDVHLNVKDAATKVPNSIQKILNETPAVSAIFVCGDLTQNATESEYDQCMKIFKDNVPESIPVYYLMGNHDWYNSATAERFTQKTGQQPNQYIEIGGYPFITISQRTQYNSGSGLYTDASVSFLSTNMAAAAEKFPDKPIFAFCHAPVINTVWGTHVPNFEGVNDQWGSDKLESTFNQYPQAILFSGHTHYTIRDERSIYQNKFTAVNDGGNNYGVMPISENRWPEGTNEITELLIVTVETNLDVHIKRLDTYQDEEIKTPWIVKAPHDGTMFEYTDDRYTSATAPSFASGAEITVETGENNQYTISFPQATDDDIVFCYKIEVLGELGTVLETYYHFSGYWLGSKAPATLSRTLTLLDGGEYTISVKAMDSFEKLSEPLTKTISTDVFVPDPDSTAPKADWLDIVFSTEGASNLAEKGIANSLFPVAGSTPPATSYDSGIKFWTSNFDGTPGSGTASTSPSFYSISYHNKQPFMTAVEKGFTMEVYCKTLDNEDRVPAGSMIQYGWGFRRDGADGVLNAKIATGSTYTNVSYPATNNTDYYHYLVTYDGARIDVYLNGLVVGSQARTGDIWMPSSNPETNKGFTIGGDTNNGTTCRLPFNGNIAFVRIHDDPVNRDQAYRLYEQVTKRSAIAEFDALNTALTVTIPGMTNEADKVAFLKKGWELMNDISTTAAQITAFLDSMENDGDWGKPGGDLDENDLNPGGAI